MTEREGGDTYDYPEGSVGRYVRERWGVVRPASTRPYVSPPAPRRVPAVEQLPVQRAAEPGGEEVDSDYVDSTRADSTRADSTRADSTRGDSARADFARADFARADSARVDTTPSDSGRVESGRVDVDRAAPARGGTGRGGTGSRRAPETTAHPGGSGALPRRVPGRTARVAGSRPVPPGVLPFPSAPDAAADGARGASVAGADVGPGPYGPAVASAAPVAPAPDGAEADGAGWVIDPGPAGAAGAGPASGSTTSPASGSTAAAGPAPARSAPTRSAPTRRGLRPAPDGPRNPAPTPPAAAPPEGGPALPETRAVPPQPGTAPPQAGAVPPQAGAALPQAGAVPPQAGAVPPQAGRVPAIPAPAIPTQVALDHRGPDRGMPPIPAVRGSGRWTDPGAVAAQEAQRARSTVDGFATDLSSVRLLRPTKRPPQSGWRRALYLLSLRLINPGESPAEQRLRLLTARANQPLRGCYKIAMLSLKGGVGKTTMTATLGATFASLRGDRVVAVDANPDRGTLSQKIPLETSATVRHLLRDAQRLRRYTDVRAYTSQGSSRLEVLASEQDPAVSEAFSEDDYRRTVNLLEHFYNIVLTDCGTGLMHSAMYGVLGVADQLIIVSSGSIDGARSASATMDWLDAHGHGELVRNSVVVINCVHRSAGGVDLDRVAAHFAARCRAVVRVPFDAHLEEGAELELDRIDPDTRLAMLELAAAVADAFEPRPRR